MFSNLQIIIKFCFPIVALLFISRGIFSTKENDNSFVLNYYCVDGIDELRPGDIFVRPNLNFLPGSSIVPNGNNFGHAAIVTSYYRHENPDSLLSNVTVTTKLIICSRSSFDPSTKWA